MLTSGHLHIVHKALWGPGKPRTASAIGDIQNAAGFCQEAFAFSGEAKKRQFSLEAETPGQISC